MVPVIVHDIGQWLDRFSDSLDRWESLLCDLRTAYVRNDERRIQNLRQSGLTIQESVVRCKDERQELLRRAQDLGYAATNLRELSSQLDSQWPALWTHRIHSLEKQLTRIQKLSMALWVNHEHSREFIVTMIRVFSPGYDARAELNRSDADAVAERPFARAA
jgi:uncharacterized coiled-coil DUF342 family protein